MVLIIFVQFESCCFVMSVFIIFIFKIFLSPSHVTEMGNLVNSLKGRGHLLIRSIILLAEVLHPSYRGPKGGRSVHTSCYHCVLSRGANNSHLTALLLTG